jgi:hypothetical protein
MAKTKMLNVRKHLELEIEFLMDMLHRNSLHQHGGISLPPIDVQAMNELVFFAKAILRKHSAKNTRKDVYVETHG